MANPKIEKYQIDIVNQLIQEMEKNPEHIKKWANIPFAPFNGAANNFYNGLNRLNLSMYLVQTQSHDPRFYTFKQIKDSNLSLNKGAKGIPVHYFKVFKIEDKITKEEKEIPFIRITYAFNAKDIKGLEPYEKTRGFESLKDNRDLHTKLNDVIKNAGVEIKHAGNKASYIPAKDIIMIPSPERFSSHEAYASTLLHELAHSTGHKSRQNRNFSRDDKNYAKEELRAELSSVFMCQKLSIKYTLENDQSHIKNSAAYVKSWINVLKNDNKELFKAATDANKITQFLIKGKAFEKAKGKYRVTEKNIQSLKGNQIFVFGSNLAGRHGKGAAQTALKWGATYGVATGLQGNTYAIPSKDKNLNTLAISEIKKYVDEFNKFATNNKEYQFLVTEIGCGLAGLKHKDIAPLFEKTINFKNVSLPQEFVNVIKENNKSKNIVSMSLNENDFSLAVDEVWSNQNLKLGTTIKLGTTPKVFQAIGVPKLPLVMNYDKLTLIKEKHKLTPEILKQVPKQINNPVAIFKNNQNKPRNSYVILTELYDKNNKPVIAALHAQRKQRRFEVNRIASIYGRNDKQIQNAFKNDLVYYHEKKCAGYFDLLSRPPAQGKNILTNKTYKVKLTSMKKYKGISR